MSKYITNSDISKFELYITLTGYLKSIQRLLDSEYIYYKTGVISKEKVQIFLNKLDPLYQLSENSVDRNRRYNLDMATVDIKFFSPGNNDIFFILLARAGINGSKKHIFFEREQYQLATDKEYRINVMHYEFIRINKDDYYFEDKKNNTKTYVPKINDVWTLQLTSHYKLLVKAEFKKYLIERNWFKISQICFGISKLIPFHKVRKDYYSLKLSLEKSFASLRRSDKNIQYKVLTDIYSMPDKLPYLRALNTKKTLLSEYINKNLLE